MAILGSKEQQERQGTDIDRKAQIIGWLKFAFVAAPDIHLTVKLGEKEWGVSDVVLSRCEVITAYHALPNRHRWAIRDILIDGRDIETVAKVWKVKPETVNMYVDQGMAAMMERIYEKLEQAV